jgi:hypothetical protein
MFQFQWDEDYVPDADDVDTNDDIDIETTEVEFSHMEHLPEDSKYDVFSNSRLPSPPTYTIEERLCDCSSSSAENKPFQAQKQADLSPLRKIRRSYRK